MAGLRPYWAGVMLATWPRAPFRVINIGFEIVCFKCSTMKNLREYSYVDSASAQRQEGIIRSIEPPAH
jgi:hypothetical protein